jgi:hypothetical protein
MWGCLPLPLRLVLQAVVSGFESLSANPPNCSASAFGTTTKRWKTRTVAYVPSFHPLFCCSPDSAFAFRLLVITDEMD